jgi:hypothetical protein
MPVHRGFTLNVASSLLTGLYPSTHGVLNWSDEFPSDVDTYADFVEATSLSPPEATSGRNFFTPAWGLDEPFETVYNLESEKSERECHQATAEEVRTNFEAVTETQESFNLLC